MLPSVSIIIPAHNAAETLGETLESVRRQTSPHWEAIVVENGSRDATAEIAAAWAAQDSRIRVATSASGVSIARNVGLGLARHPWILFLDADDWILPAHLERLTQRLADDPQLDAAHCGWRRVDSTGAILNEDFGPPDPDLFPRLARTCVITIHSCITRRALIEAAGGFDATLRTCEDWDLWQRVARLGCRFGQVREVLACYRARAGSASMNAAQLIADSRKVIERGHGADPRLTAPRPEYATGIPPENIGETLLYTVAWAAGLAIGGGVDAAPLVDLVETSGENTLDPSGVAGCIFCCAMLPAALPTSAWAERFETLAPLLEKFLAKLEAKAGQPGLARATCSHLSRMALEQSTRPRPFTVGNVHAIDVEITAPLADLVLAASVERVDCVVSAAGEKLGKLELPVIDGALPASILTDAIAAEFAWTILGRFFTGSVYPSLAASKHPDGWAVRRGSHSLATGLAGNGTMSWATAHDQIGWTVFLQELWGNPDSTSDDFYNATPDRTAPAPAAIVTITAPLFAVEASEPWPDAWTVGDGVAAVLTVGGAPVVQTRLSAGLVTARALRARLTAESAFELCCASVREGLIGQPFTATESLRSRLAARAETRRAKLRPIAPHAEVQFLPESSAVLQEYAPAGVRLLTLPRHPGACGTSISRRGLLPRVLLPEIAAARARRGEPVLGDAADADARVLYAPELFWRRSAPPARIGTGGVADRTGFGRDFFEQLFRDKPNPWLYTTEYEQKKYEQTLAVLPRPRFRRGLELACAEGHFTRQLAPRVDRLLATDISTTALQRAAGRCREMPQVEFAELDLFNDPLPGRYDLIVCSEVLYYAGSVGKLRAIAKKIARALEPGGCFVTAHAHLVVDEPHRPGYDWDLPYGAKRIGEVFSETAPLRLIKDLRTPLYRVQAFERLPPVRRWFFRKPAEKILLPQPTELPPHAAARALWRGGYPQRTRSETAVQCAELPILMYHRIAPLEAGGRARYRTSPEALDAQLRLLAARGFRCVSLDEWRKAMEARRPLPGRCVAITFDDGYRDFLEYAWPALQRHGFTATMYLPTDRVGQSNVWDRKSGDVSKLLTWDEIRQLRNEGVEFGSHSATHPNLASLSPTEIAREALRSRFALEEQLEAPVTSFAYPFGETDRVVQQIVGTCGYTYGLTCDERACSLSERPLALPRLEVRGGMSLRDFEALLPAS